MTEPGYTTIALEEAARLLETSEEFRVLRLFKPQDRYGQAATDGMTSAAFLDVESTGVESHDVPIEIGVVRVEFDPATGELGKVLERYQSLQDPGRPIPDHIVALTGITDEEVRGKQFDEGSLKALIKRSAIVVAHNAPFDRVMVEKLFPWMEKRPWGCTCLDIPWQAAGVSSKKLEFVAVMRGFFYKAHRALEDAEMAAAIAGKPLLEGRAAFHWVLENARADWYRLWATDAPYEAKGRLHAAGYEWKDGKDGGHKAWRILTKDPVAEAEWLACEIYGYRGKALLQQVGRNDRFSERFDGEEWLSMARG